MARQDKFDHYFFTPVAAVRLLLVEKCVLVMLAFDMWFLRIGAANRYDADELNLAHFDWLDALGPTPSAGLYIGVAVLVGVLALAVAIANLGLPWRLALVILYSYTWSMSRLDSFQHHYLLSWVLLCIAFFPRVRLADFWKASVGLGNRPGGQGLRQTPLFYAWSWVLLGTFAAIVFCYTSLAKVDTVWQSGACLRQLQGTASLLAPFESAFVSMGGTVEAFWSWVALATVVIELLVAVGYLLMPLADRPGARRIRQFCFVCWLLAIALHSGFELAQLRIGWFSYFMMALASASFLPSRWLEQLLRPFFWMVPAEPLAQNTEPSKHRLRIGTYVATTLLAVVVLVVVGYWADLPGVLPAVRIVAICFVATMIYLSGRNEFQLLRRLPIAVLVAAILLAMSLQFGDGRSKFYPYRLAQLQRRCRFDLASEMLPKAEAYVNSNDLFGQYNLAWFYASTADESLRDGAKAVEYALRSCELCDYKNVSALDTLACAQATNGDFDGALKTIKRAKQLLGGDATNLDYSDLEEHERLFREKRPYVETCQYRYRHAADAGQREPGSKNEP